MVENIVDKEKQKQLIQTTIITGLVSGIFFGAIGFIASFFHMSDINPNIILTPFFTGKWASGWLGLFITLILFALISIGVAFIYYFILRKMPSIWIGVCFGIALFLITFFCIPFLLPQWDSLLELSRDTIITVGCIYILYGAFIGYSISYEALQISYDKAKDTK